MNGNMLIPQAGDEELRDIHAYQAIIIPSYVLWTLIFIVLVIAGVFLYKFIKSRQTKEELSVFEKLIINLEAMNVDQDSKSFYLEYSDVVRSYLLERLSINLFDKTLDEAKELLNKETILGLESKKELLHIFSRADMAKFARQDISIAKRVEHIENTKKILEAAEANVLEQEAQKDKEVMRP